MGKHYPQTEEAKRNFTNLVFKYIVNVRKYNDKNHIFTKDELVSSTGYSERMVRSQLSEIANYYPIIATSDRKGYKLLSFDDETSDEELKTMFEETEHQIAELQSRIDALKARMKPLIAFKETARKELVDREFDIDDDF